MPFTPTGELVRGYSRYCRHAEHADAEKLVIVPGGVRDEVSRCLICLNRPATEVTATSTQSPPPGTPSAIRMRSPRVSRNTPFHFHCSLARIDIDRATCSSFQSAPVGGMRNGKRFGSKVQGGIVQKLGRSAWESNSQATGELKQAEASSDHDWDELALACLGSPVASPFDGEAVARRLLKQSQVPSSRFKAISCGGGNFEP